MTRSWWGWGTVEDAVRGPELKELLARVRALAPGDLTDHPPPDIASLGVPASRIAATNSRWGVPVGNASRTRSPYPLMTVRRLLKSCATPPVSWPIASIF